MQPFNHNTSVTDRQTTAITTARPLLKCGRLKNGGLALGFGLDALVSIF